MDTHITILMGSTVIMNHIYHTLIIHIIPIAIGDFRCMGTAIGMVITHITERGTGTTVVGTGVIKGVGKVDIMENGVDLAGIMVVDIEVGTVDERYENQQGLTLWMKQDIGQNVK